MTYTPTPLDTRAICLSDEQRALVEALASNVHDVWAQKRIGEGWTYGPQRDDALKTHPDLVPYAQLSEAEKDYDRAMIEQVLKAALVLGYRIGKA